jgi:hypothetical protein
MQERNQFTCITKRIGFGCKWIGSRTALCQLRIAATIMSRSAHVSANKCLVVRRMWVQVQRRTPQNISYHSSLVALNTRQKCVGVSKPTLISVKVTNDCFLTVSTVPSLPAFSLILKPDSATCNRVGIALSPSKVFTTGGGGLWSGCPTALTANSWSGAPLQ